MKSSELLDELFAKLNTQGANGHTLTKSEQATLLAFAVAAQKHSAQDFDAVMRLALHEERLTEENNRLNARVKQLEGASAIVPTTGTSEVQSLNARIVSLEKENASLLSRSAIIPTTSPVTATPVTVTKSLAESSFATIARLVAGVTVQNLTQRAAASNGLPQTVALLSAQLAESNRVLADVVAVVASATKPNLTTQAVAAISAKGGKR